MKQHLEGTQVILEKNQHKRNEEQIHFMEALSSSQKDVEELKLIAERLSHEKKEKMLELQEIKIELEEVKVINQELKDELALIKTTFKNSEGFQGIIKNLEKEKQDLVKILFDKKKDYVEYNFILIVFN